MHKGAEIELKIAQIAQWRSTVERPQQGRPKNLSQMRRFKTPAEHEATRLAITRGVPQTHTHTNTHTYTHCHTPLCLHLQIAMALFN